MNDKYTKHSMMMMTDKKYCRRKVGFNPMSPGSSALKQTMMKKRRSLVELVEIPQAHVEEKPLRQLEDEGLSLQGLARRCQALGPCSCALSPHSQRSEWAS